MDEDKYRTLRARTKAAKRLKVLAIEHDVKMVDLLDQAASLLEEYYASPKNKRRKK